MRPEPPAAPALVLFDLDGTLADTFPDLAWALGRALAEHGLPAHGARAVRAHVSGGARAMTAAALEGTRGGDVEAIRTRFLELYLDNLAVRTRLFDGMPAVLAALEREGTGIGIVTNKVARFTDPLVDALELRGRLRCLVSGDSTARPKPFPDPLLHAAAAAGVAAARCLYVGDARNDVRAARAAGMSAVVATYGYLAPEDDPHAWHADHLIAHPLELLPWLARGQV